MIKQYICPEQLCVGCGACAQKCPENAISMEMNGKNLTKL